MDSFQTNLVTVFSSLKREVVSPFEKGPADVYNSIAAAPSDAVMFLDAPDDFPLDALHAAASASGKHYVIASHKNSVQVRKSLREMGLHLFQVAGSEGGEGVIFASGTKLGGHPAVIPVSSQKIVIKKSHLEIYKTADSEEGIIERRMLTGVAMAVHEADSDGEFFSPETVYDTMVDHMLYYRRTGLEHVVDITDDVSLIENWVTRADIQHAGRLVRAGSWMQTYKIWNLRLWEAAKRGDIAGLSIGGDAGEISAEMDIPQ